MISIKTVSGGRWRGMGKGIKGGGWVIREKIWEESGARKDFGDMKEKGTEKTWHWVQGGNITKTMEGFIVAAQEQALRIR